MDTSVFDSGRVRVEPVGDAYLHFSLYGTGELTGQEMAALRAYVDHYDDKVSIVVTRDSEDYWFSADAQKEMYLYAGARVKAVAYVDRSNRDRRMSEYADQTFLKDVEVQSFVTLADAVAWVAQFGPLPARRVSSG